LHIGLFNKTKANSEFTDSIIHASRNSIKSFKIAENTYSKKEEFDETTKEYVFAKADNVIKDISNYLSKSKINLLLVDRRKENLINTNIKDIINNIDCSLLLI
jgi:vacuolar-type H+-ATPase subunit I/STV1